MKYLYLLLLLALIEGCQPKVLPTNKKYGCVYGKLKKSDNYGELIRCSNYEIWASGNNQEAADKIAETLGIKYENVRNMTNYVDWKYVEKPDCNCRGTLEY